MTAKTDPTDLAEQFMRLSPDEFRQFWAHIQYVWNIEDEGADIEAGWFMCGKTIGNFDTVIIAMLGAVRSGKRS